MPPSVRISYLSCCLLHTFTKRLWSVRRCAGRGERKTVAFLYVDQPPAGLTQISRSPDVGRGIFSPLAPGRVTEARLLRSLSHCCLCISQNKTLGSGSLEELFSLVSPSST